MSAKSASTYTVLHMCIRLRGEPHVLLARSQEAATIIASAEGLIWKIWVLQNDQSEIGGVYLFANREAAEAYLNHPVIQALSSNPSIVSTESRLWEVEGSLSAITRAPLRDTRVQHSESDALMAGGR